METVRRWFTWYDEREAGARLPQVAGYAAIIFAFSGDAERSDRWADIADGAFDGASAGSDDVDRVILAVARVVRARHGLVDLRATAELAARTAPDGHPFRIAALACMGLAAQLEGDYEAADAALESAVMRHTPGSFANTAAILAHAFLATNALRRGERSVAEDHVRRARSILVANHLTEEALSVGIDALEARIALGHGASAQARSDLAHAQRIRPLLTETIPWFAVQARLDLIRAHLALDDKGGARLLLGEIRDILAIRPDLGSLVAETNELAERLERLRGGTAGSSTLTLAELRLLPLLTTHLSFREIGERLFVSQNTVKTQAISIYRKLEVTSRSEAIDRAVELGLLEAPAPRERFIPRG
jgi:LuxR family maltose regulon positive regulatory protein